MTKVRSYKRGQITVKGYIRNSKNISKVLYGRKVRKAHDRARKIQAYRKIILDRREK